MEKVKFGVIGVGNQGSYYSTALFRDGKIENGVLVAVCDKNPKKLDTARENLKDMDVQYFDNYIEMIESGVCDAIIVTTPHYDHPTIVMDCL